MAHLTVKSVQVITSRSGAVDLVYTLESGAKTVPIRVFDDFRLGDTLHITHEEGAIGPNAFSIREKLI